MSALTLHEALKLAVVRRAQLKLFKYLPYPWQYEFHMMGGTYSQRMLMAANRTGKTFSAAGENSMHLTGWYPDWWDGIPTETLLEFWATYYADKTGDDRWKDRAWARKWAMQFGGGRRFDHPIVAWFGSQTSEQSRDVVQGTLLDEPKGTGSIPGEYLDKNKPYTFRQAGIGDVVDTINVCWRKGKALSTASLKTYEQGWAKWQGKAVHSVWDDEEPDDMKVFTEGLTRTVDTQGLMTVTFTPLRGETDMVRHFKYPKKDAPVYLKGASWDEAPHLDTQAKRALIASYPEHEIDTRTKGIPMMGQGAVFTTREEDVKTDPFRVPSWWRHICGIDFGSDHPFGASWLAYDPENDVIYVYDCFRISGQTPVYHAQAINSRGNQIPVAWPHDGTNTEKGSGVPLKDYYLRQNVNMLVQSARYTNDKAGPQPVNPIFDEWNERERSGRLRIFSTCVELLEERRNLHRDDKNKIVAKRDDVVKAACYAMMMLRYAAPLTTNVIQMPVYAGVSTNL